MTADMETAALTSIDSLGEDALAVIGSFCDNRALVRNARATPGRRARRWRGAA
jgi:hypothetical protein